MLNQKICLDEKEKAEKIEAESTMQYAQFKFILWDSFESKWAAWKILHAKMAHSLHANGPWSCG